jgi:hypothetical protein
MIVLDHRHCRPSHKRANFPLLILSACWECCGGTQADRPNGNRLACFAAAVLQVDVTVLCSFSSTSDWCMASGRASGISGGQASS